MRLLQYDKLLAIGLMAPGVLGQTAGLGHFFFQWPSTTTQCEVITLTWNNATAPFSCWILPMGSQPFLYNIPNSAYVNGTGSYDIQLQLNSGTNFIVLMSDANGLGSGGTAEIQQVGSSQHTSCLNTASKNQTASQFSFSVAGHAKQCMTGFATSWTASTADEPYNYTVLPLDQGFFPFEVPLSTSRNYDGDWQLNLTTGTRFTIAMNNKNGRGTGGVGGIYQVANSSDSSCVSQTMDPTGSWPVGIATNTLPATTLPTSTSSSSSSMSGGVIAGLVIGVMAAVVLVTLLLFFLLRRRRRRRAQMAAEAQKTIPVDLGDEYTEYENPGPAPVVEPYREVGHIAPPQGPYGTEGSGDLPSTEHEHEAASSTTAGFAGLGAGQGRSSWVPGRFSGEEAALVGEGDLSEGPGIAGPLPSKSPRGSNVNRQSTSLRPPRNSVGGLSAKSTENSPGIPGPSSGPVMRVVNHDDPDELPAVPPGTAEPHRRSQVPQIDDSPRRTTFRRHEDAGRVDVVDLPPLYTDVPRDGAMRLEGGPGDAEGRISPATTSPGREEERHG